MPEDLFCESLFTIQCILGKKIKAIILVDTCATRFGFINNKFAEIICHILEIQLQRLTRLKLIQNLIAERLSPLFMLFILPYL